MSLLHLPLDQIREADLRALVKSTARESRTIEYKEKLPTNPEENDKFCSTVCSFANTDGGDVVFGMKEKREGEKHTGEPEEIVPLNTNFDTERLRLLQLIRSNIEPRLPGSHIEAVQVTGGHVYILRIQKSWLGMHGVRKNEAYRFYQRTSAGRSTMDMTEIRAGFVATEQGYERIQRFRTERIEQILKRETPVDIAPGPATIMHIIPLSFLNPTIQFDIKMIERDDIISPIYSTSYTHRYSFNGLVKYDVEKPSPSYVQISRNGVIEACMADLFHHEKPLIFVSEIEDRLIKALPPYLAGLVKLGVSRPLVIGLTITGIHDFSAVTPRFSPTPATPFREKMLVIPEILVSSEEIPSDVLLRPAFDRIWNAAGLPRSLSYDEAGNWKGKS